MTKLLNFIVVCSLAACGGNGAKPSTSPSSPAEAEANGGTAGATGGQTYGAKSTPAPSAEKSPTNPSVTP